MAELSFIENLKRSISVNQNAFDDVDYQYTLTEGIQAYKNSALPEDNPHTDNKLKLIWFEGWLWAASFAQRWDDKGE